MNIDDFVQSSHMTLNIKMQEKLKLKMSSTFILFFLKIKILISNLITENNHYNLSLNNVFEPLNWSQKPFCWNYRQFHLVPINITSDLNLQKIINYHSLTVEKFTKAFFVNRTTCYQMLCVILCHSLLYRPHHWNKYLKTTWCLK